MAIKFDTSPYVRLEKKEPRGSRMWRFLMLAEGQGPKTLNTDGPWPEAKKAAMEVAKSLGKRDVVIEVHPF